MPWIVGVDEAGYGPNLGPFVMTAVACQVSPRLVGRDLWQVLRAAVRRADEAEDGRTLVADSKLIYTPARGLLALETGVLAMLAAALPEDDWSLSACLNRLCPVSCAALAREVWYRGDSRLPLSAVRRDVENAANRFHVTCQKRRVACCAIRSIVICPRAFNELVAVWGSKGAVLAHGLLELIQHIRAVSPDGEPLAFFIDKHGGRNNYAAILQHALPDAMIVCRREGAAQSCYAALGLRREMRFTFEPRADSSHFCVALASMVSKYLREALMGEFNRFWQTHLPALKPTAGYPSDAARFLRDVQPAMQQLGVHESAIWRRK
jgi:ribonuclease HII